ncbi:hypothetical protein F5Y03DRAFT_93614 [Xylaria venustula]|nr:hypothetical protein F5Y03DRAFT_93614 [Xylaria venustula]
MPEGKLETKLVIGTASAELVSGGSGSFVGSFLGVVYATCNGAGSGTICPEGGDAYFSRWTYISEAQYITTIESVKGHWPWCTSSRYAEYNSLPLC